MIILLSHSFFLSSTLSLSLSLSLPSPPPPPLIISSTNMLLSTPVHWKSVTKISQSASTLSPNLSVASATATRQKSNHGPRGIHQHSTNLARRVNELICTNSSLTRYGLFSLVPRPHPVISMLHAGEEATVYCL